MSLFVWKQMSIFIKKFISHILGSFTSQDPGKKKVAHWADFIEEILTKEDKTYRGMSRVNKTHKNGQAPT